MTITERISALRQRIAEEEIKSHRPQGCVQLLAVSKGQSIERIREAYACGIKAFGENYLQEAKDKIEQLAHLPIQWHFIGPIQSNKTRFIASHFDWVHSVDRIKIAERLDHWHPPSKPKLNICLQINLSGEKTKSGMKANEAMENAAIIKSFKQLQCRGLMTIPPEKASAAETLDLFNELKRLMTTLNEELGMGMDTLSMGMSNDLSEAIAAGSTMVRIGRALFGERQ